MRAKTSEPPREVIALPALIDISRAVSTPAPLRSVLATIANKTTELIEVDGAVILLSDPVGSLGMSGSHGLSSALLSQIEEAAGQIPVEPDGVGVLPALPVAGSEGFQTFKWVALDLDGAPIGVLVVCDRRPRAWSADQLEFLDLIRAHIAAAVRTAQLIDEQKHRLAAHARLVRGLRDQTDSNFVRLQAIQAELRRGDTEGVADLLIDVENELSQFYAFAAERIECRLVASLLLGEAGIARRRGVAFHLDRRSRLRRLPATLNESQVVSIIGNLLQNAFDAVAGMPRGRRRVTLLIRDSEKGLRVRVRDWGPGLEGASNDELMAPGFTTKPGHSGVGLAIVRGIATDAGGTVGIERLKVGIAIELEVPHD